MKRIYSIQESIYNNLKKKALFYEQDLTTDLRKYKKNQNKFTNRMILKSNYQDLMSSIIQSEIIYLGDFHTFDQNSRNLERITKYLMNKNSLIIGMEFIEHQYQVYIDHYLSGKLTELEFIESINYKQSWRFPWKRFELFFKLAKQNNLKIIGLNSNGTLKERDTTAASIINNYMSIYPKSKLLVLFGELHLMPNKLPSEVQKIASIELVQTIIHQNIDSVFWKSQHWPDKQKQIIKFNDHEFVIQTSAPWIKYESLLYWYENIEDDPEFDLHDYIIETGRNTLNSSSSENFIYLIEKIADSFNIKKTRLNHDFHLYDHLKINLLNNKIHKLESPSLQKLFISLLNNNDFFFLPNTNIFYCPNYSINRLSYLAGIKLFIDLNPSFSKLLKNKTNVNFFIYYLHIHYFAYIASKIINPYRKTDMAIDMNNKRSQKEYALAHKLYSIRSINDLKVLISRKSKFIIYRSVKIFAFSIAEYVFEKVYNQKKYRYSKFLNFSVDENQFLEISIINDILTKKEIHRKRKRYF